MHFIQGAFGQKLESFSDTAERKLGLAVDNLTECRAADCIWITCELRY